jgi:hypothetical protein
MVRLNRENVSLNFFIEYSYLLHSFFTSLSYTYLNERDKTKEEGDRNDKESISEQGSERCYRMFWLHYEEFIFHYKFPDVR